MFPLAPLCLLPRLLQADAHAHHHGPGAPPAGLLPASSGPTPHCPTEEPPFPAQRGLQLLWEVSLHCSTFAGPEPCPACPESTSAPSCGLQPGPLRWASALLLQSAGRGVGTGPWARRWGEMGAGEYRGLCLPSPEHSVGTAR